MLYLKYIFDSVCSKVKIMFKQFYNSHTLEENIKNIYLELNNKISISMMIINRNDDYNFTNQLIMVLAGKKQLSGCCIQTAIYSSI